MDGSLSVLGVVIGALNPDSTIVIAAGLAGSMANGMSNLWAAFTAEYAEQYRYLKEVEEAMTIPLRATIQEERLKQTVHKGAIMDAISSMVGGVMPVLPFLFLDAIPAAITAIAIVLVVMVLLGIYIGKISRMGMARSIIKMIFFVLITSLVAFIIERTVGVVSS